MKQALVFNSPVIAHRGASADAPENTLAAIRAAALQGAEWVEFDVKLTRDGVPILMHDDDLDRTTNGHGPVAAEDWATIRKLDAGSFFGPAFAGEPVPHFRDVLGAALEHGLKINVELKPCPDRAQATVMVALMEIAKHWPEDAPAPLISSFDRDCLALARQFHPEWPRGLLLDTWHADWRDLAAATGAAVIGLDEALLTPERAAALRGAGLPLLAYTVDDPVRAQSLLSAGINAIFCNGPKAMLAALAASPRPYPEGTVCESA